MKISSREKFSRFDFDMYSHNIDIRNNINLYDIESWKKTANEILPITYTLLKVIGIHVTPSCFNINNLYFIFIIIISIFNKIPNTCIPIHYNNIMY